MRTHMFLRRQVNTEAHDSGNNTCRNLKLAFEWGFCFGINVFQGTYYPICMHPLKICPKSQKYDTGSKKNCNNGPDKGAELWVDLYLLSETVCCHRP